MISATLAVSYSVIGGRSAHTACQCRNHSQSISSVFSGVFSMGSVGLLAGGVSRDGVLVHLLSHLVRGGVVVVIR
jgi:hypothetical protein